VEQLFVRDIQDIVTRAIVKYAFFAMGRVLKKYTIRLDSISNVVVVRRYIEGMGSREGF